MVAASFGRGLPGEGGTHCIEGACPWPASPRSRAQKKPPGARTAACQNRSNRRAAHQSSISNDVDDCVKRAGASRGAVSAQRDRTSKSPAPTDDRGRRRDRGRASRVPRSADSEDEETEDLHTSPRQNICRRTRGPGLSPTPSVFWKMRAAWARPNGRAGPRRLDGPRLPSPVYAGGFFRHSPMNFR